MLDEHFLVSINAWFARVMYICGTERSEQDARLPGGEYSPLCKLKYEIAHKNVAPLFLVKSLELSLSRPV